MKFGVEVLYKILPGNRDSCVQGGEVALLLIRIVKEFFPLLSSFFFSDLERILYRRLAPNVIEYVWIS